MTTPGLSRSAAGAAGIAPAVTRTLLLTMAALVIVYFAADLVVRSSMFSDSGWGFLGWDAMRRGAPFNYSLLPDPADISRDRLGFMTFWSPGQHVLPGLLENLGIELGVALALVAVCFSVLGLIGWYALYRTFGFDPAVATIALAIVTCSRFFSLPFSIYNGGEVLLFGTAPWFMLMAWRLRGFPWYALPALLAGAFVLFFAKLSGVILAIATIGATAVSVERPWALGRNWRRYVLAGVTIAVFGLLFQHFWIARGETAVPEGTGLQWSRLVTHTAYSLTAIVVGAFSPGDLASWLFLHPGRELLGSIDRLYFLASPAALAVLVFVVYRLRSRYADYLRFLLWTAAAITAAMLLLWLKGSAVSLEERHFRPVSMLFLVGLVQACLVDSRRWLQALFLVVVVASSAYGLLSFANRLKTNLHYPLGARGVRHTIANEAAVKFLHRIDVVGPQGQVPLVLVTSPEMALELRHARVIANQADFQGKDELASQVYKGRVPSIYVVVQKRLVDDGKAAAILRSFVDYAPDKWTSTPLGDFVAFSQGGQ